jgi:xanthine dehydrogenase accessory factor
MIPGVLRGQVRPNGHVRQGLKLGDIDPRGERAYLHTISDKGRAIGGSVLEAVLRVYN